MIDIKEIQESVWKAASEEKIQEKQPWLKKQQLLLNQSISLYL